MTLEKFHEMIAAGLPLEGAEMVEFMREQSDESRKAQFELNCHFHTPDEIRALFSQITGEKVDETFRLFPPFYTDFGRSIRVGKNVFINSCCQLQDQGGIYIGDGCLIGHSVVMATLNHDLDPEKRQNLSHKPIRLGRNVWVGARATILQGVTIGDNSVVAAGAVVSKDIPANEVWGGVPAKFIKKSTHNNTTKMKNILIISTSPRKGGNSDTLAHEFERGAKEAGNNVEYVSLADKRISFCRGCLACGKTHRCVINDDAIAIVEKMHDADVIVWATPVYYYSVSGQMKTMIDRANPLYDTDYKFIETYLLASAAEDEEQTVSGATTAIQGWVDCFERLSLKGVIFAGGVNDKGDINGHKALAEAYETGKSVK